MCQLMEECLCVGGCTFILVKATTTTRRPRPQTTNVDYKYFFDGQHHSVCYRPFDVLQAYFNESLSTVFGVWCAL